MFLSFILSIKGTSTGLVDAATGAGFATVTGSVPDTFLACGVNTDAPRLNGFAMKGAALGLTVG